MSSLQETRSKLANHFANGTADEGGRWAALWDKGDFLPWDRHMPNPALEDLLKERQDLLGSPAVEGSNGKKKRKQALVPGCGRGVSSFPANTYTGRVPRSKNLGFHLCSATS